MPESPLPQVGQKRARPDEDSAGGRSNASAGNSGDSEGIAQSSAEPSTTSTPPEFVDVDVSGETLVQAESSKVASSAAQRERGAGTPPRAQPRGSAEHTTDGHSPTSLMSTSASAAGPSCSSFTAAGGSAAADARRMRQPTLAAYGMVSDTAALKKELSDRDSQIEELREKVGTLEQNVQQRDSHIDFVDGQLQKVSGKLAQYQHVMREEMLRAAKQARTEARRVLHQKHFELGQIATWLNNGREVWVEGDRMRDLIMKLAEISKQRDEVEGLKKAAQTTVKQLTRQERDREDSAFGLDTSDALFDAQAELQLRTSQHAALVNTISTYKQAQADLENEKKAFLKEIRRVNDEDASEFMAVPTIGEGDRYVLMALLGKGGFSEVWRAFDVVEGQYVACKIHRVQREWSAQTRAHYLRHAERELEIMRSLDHPHLTRLHNVFQLSETMFVSVMEFSEGMDLDTYLKRYRTLKEADARLILLQMVSALRHLAGLENPIIHYDLKPANILLHSCDPSVLEIKITDFGLSKIIGPTREGPSDNPSIELTSQGTGTYWYLPPECFETSSTPRISSKVDIWSIGVIFYQMLFGRRPFAEGESQRKIWQEKLILSSARTLTFPDTPKVSEEAKELMAHCLAFNVEERYDIFQLSQHPYLFRPTRRATKGKSVAPPN